MRVLAIDWSGDARVPDRRIRVAEARDGRLVGVRGGLDREGTVEHVRTLAARGPLVAGFDFSFGLPGWFARELGCPDAPALWEVVAREGEDWLRRCPPPFWGRPGTRRPAPDPARPLWRATERDSPHHPSSTFQVGGAGAVGTGSLRGMPLLRGLRAAGVAVWPFDDAAGEAGATVVEIYPRDLTGPVVKSDPDARRAHAAADARILAGLLDAVAASEDAFDAACSAVVMAGRTAELATLRARPEDALEGRIWRPGER